MRRFKQYIEVIHKKLTKEDWDNVWIIAGDEGTGKTNLGLHFFEYWYSLIGKNSKDKIRYIALGIEDFATSLKDAFKFCMLMYDEAGDLSNKRQMDKFNYLITRVYQVIRGENIFTLLILPSVFDLNPFFTTRRARGLIQVYARGRAAFWNKKKLRRIIEVNRFRKVKKVWRVTPLFYDTFPIYKGMYKEEYEEKKKAKMEKIRQEVYEEIVEDEDGNGMIDDRVFVEEAFKRDFDVKDLLNKVEYSQGHLYRIKRKMYNMIEG